MIKLIAETAWHHEGDYDFMQQLVEKICTDSSAHIIKLHITLDLNEYMDTHHEAYTTLLPWIFSEEQWKKLIGLIRFHGKELMLLLNDSSAIRFAAQFQPEVVELHSVCLNVPNLQKELIDHTDPKTKVAIGVGGCTLQEVDAAVQVFSSRETILMFGFQNYPTRYENVNLAKIRKIQALYNDKNFGYADHTGWNEPNNELITLLVAANGMNYVEKHVSTAYGVERCDSSAAISVDMLNMLASKIKVLDRLQGTGSLALNEGERSYSQYGPMKMAAVAARELEKDTVLTEGTIRFCRTRYKSRLSQLDIIESFGRRIRHNLPAGHVIQHEDFE
ncbi:MAG: N-acetylneuraminate synthase family protein [Candidatus Electrothrix scaldis]|nr:MAG: N-acetylneuraminate synthase family protein [Candidatus Electrothrix sp. GW3-3]